MKKILVAVDGSEPSLRGLEASVPIARAFGAQLTVVEVIEPFGPLPGYYGAPPPGAERREWLAEQRFERAHELLDATDVPWDRVVREGHPADEICALAEEGGYDLIVVGARGQSAVGRFLTGSVSDRIVHHAPGAVLVVR